MSRGAFGCEARLLASSEIGHIAACSCGRVHLHLRAGVSLHLAEEDLSELGRLVSRALGDAAEPGPLRMVPKAMEPS